MGRRFATLLGSLVAVASLLGAAPLASFPVAITVDATRGEGALPPIWRFFGADEPNYATMKDGRALLAELGKLRPDDVYFRTHNLLNTGDGTPAFKWGSTNVYTEDAQGRPVYDWTTVDRIIDTYRARGVRPYLQVGFMPQALSSAAPGTPYQHAWRPGFAYKLIAGGWNAPPRDEQKWAELVYRWTRHNVDRYGRSEVERWYFETWNEPNSPTYWSGTPEQFYRLHDLTVDAIRRALPTARVGGPDVAGVGGAFMDGFLRHITNGTNAATGRVGTPTDFLSFHAKGQPRFVDGYVEMGIARHLATVQSFFGKLAAVPALAGKPVVIGESDPEGCAACPGPQNAYRNGTMYSSYTAASMVRIWELAVRERIRLDGVLTWAFEFEDQPWFAGYRQLATNCVALPVLNVFRLFAKLGEQRLVATSDGEVPLDRIVADGVRGRPDVGVLATRGAGGQVAVLVWHYHDADVPGPDAAVRMTVNGVTARSATLWRVDRRHADAFTAWQAMGSPTSPDERQYAQLQVAAALVPEPLHPVIGGRQTALDLLLPRQGVALVVLDGG